MSPSTLSKVTTDHDEIRRWAEERGAKPSAVIRTEHGDDPGIIRLDFPGYSGEGSLEEISWDEWFRKFDERNLALLYQEHTAGGEKSNFNKIVSRETAEQVESGKHERRSSSRSASGSHVRGTSQQRQSSSQKRTSGTRSKTASAGSPREKRLEKREEDGRERTKRKSVSARGRGSSTGRTSTRSRASEKRSSSSRGGAARRTEARSSRTTGRSGGRHASARSSGKSGTRSKRSSSPGSSRKSGSGAR